MLELRFEHERMDWQRRILQEDPFMAKDLWSYFGFLTRLHGHVWGDDFNPYLELQREDNYFYRLGYGDGDPEMVLEEDRYDAYVLHLARIRTQEEQQQDMRRGACAISDREDVESFTFEKRGEEGPENYVMWREFNDGHLFSPSSKSKVLYEQGRMRLYDTKQNGKGFGLSLARNLWSASNFTFGGSSVFASN